MRRRNDKYVAEALRNMGTAFVIGSLFREESPGQAAGLFAAGLVMLVLGWLFASRDE